MFFFIKKIMHGFYNKFVKFQRIVAYISEIQKKNILFSLISEIINFYIRFISGIK